MPPEPLRGRTTSAVERPVAGDDVEVLFPSGNIAEGRITRWLGGRAMVWLDGGESRIYPKSWVYPWGHAPDRSIEDAR